jgi:hypothetical protein
MTITMLDIAKRNGHDAITGIIEEAMKATPEVSGIHPTTRASLPGVGDARTINGTHYKTLVRTSLPTVDFRNGNEGVTASQSTWANRLVECFTMNPRWHVDKAVADRSEDGPAMMLADEALGQIQAIIQKMGNQFFYGRNTNGSTKGFPGLLDVYDSTNMVVDAGGTTDSVSTSVWAVKFGPQDVRWVFGANGSMEPSEVELRDVDDSDGNPFTAYFQEMFLYPGLQVGQPDRCVARIKKLTTDSGKGLTDARLSSLMAKFPVGVRPDAIFLTNRSLYQLRDSRTATSEDGREAPLPMTYDGVPLVPTQSILNTETLAS